MLGGLESNSQPPTWQPDAQPIDPPVHRSGFYIAYFQLLGPVTEVALEPYLM